MFTLTEIFLFFPLALQGYYCYYYLVVNDTPGGLKVKKKEIIEKVKIIHALVSGKTKLDTFQVLNRIDFIAMDILTATASVAKSKGANR